MPRAAQGNGSPWHFSATLAQIDTAPELGEHTDAILADLGYTTGQIEDFRERGIV
jgi:crotonobetainyl-CoA:carnitine CoA-transferase CaiB-like acyl-CoA transferase